MSERDGTGPDGLTDLERASRARMTPAARASQALTAAPRRATQAEIEAASRKYSTAAGEAGSRAGLAEPLTDAELKTGDGYGVGITDVDCTPRPRYGESQERFLRRMAGYGADVEQLRREIRMRNRAAALRSTEIETHSGGTRLTYWTVCPCGWCGLRADDPEVVRREYDAHECVAEGVGQAAVDRAIEAAAHPHAGLVKRTQHVLQPAIVEHKPEHKPEELVPSRTEVDDLEQRVALLEPHKR